MSYTIDESDFTKREEYDKIKQAALEHQADLEADKRRGELIAAGMTDRNIRRQKRGNVFKLGSYRYKSKPKA